MAQRESIMAPIIELFITGQKLVSYNHIQRLQVWGLKPQVTRRQKDPQMAVKGVQF
jgi:hypothetical protein